MQWTIRKNQRALSKGATGLKQSLRKVSLEGLQASPAGLGEVGSHSRKDQPGSCYSDLGMVMTQPPKMFML